MIKVAVREWQRMRQEPVYLFSIVIIPIFCYILFTTLMANGLPTKLPAGVVDADDSQTSRNITRNLGAFQYTDITAHFASFDEAAEAMRKGDIYGFFYLPPKLESDLMAGRKCRTSFYLNDAYLVAGSLLYRDMRTLSELTNGAVQRTQFYAHGMSSWETASRLQPIVIETHPLNNPWLNYSVYLNNTLLPGVLLLMVMLITIYSIGTELKEKTTTQWLESANGNIITALAGKLLPQTTLFIAIAWIGDIWLYCVLHFPCHNGMAYMMIASVMAILATQGLGIFIYSLFPWMRFAMSIASLWGVISFSISGFTFPVMAMNPALQALCNLFPLRHYFLIYANGALNGNPTPYAASSFIALTIFMLLPLITIQRLKHSLTNDVYMA